MNNHPFKIANKITNRGWSGGLPEEAGQFITQGGITSTTQITAISYLVTALKENNLWDAMTVIYPFVGGTQAAHSLNLKSPGTNSITTWTGAIVHDSNGISGTNSQNASATSSYSNGSDDATNLSFGFYGSNVFMGGTNPVIMYTNNSAVGNASNNSIYMQSGIVLVRISGSVVISSTNTSNGLILVTTASGTAATWFKNQFNLGTPTRSTIKGNFWAFSLSTTSAAANNNIRFAFVGKQMSDSQLQTFNIIVETYQSLLGRGQYTINSSYDRWVNRFINNVGDGNLSLIEKYALNYLYTNLDTSGIFAKLSFMYPILGTNAATQTKDFINLTSMALSGSFTHTSLGMDPQTTASSATIGVFGNLGGIINFFSIYVNEHNSVLGYDMDAGNTNRYSIITSNGTNATFNIFQGTGSTFSSTSSIGLWSSNTTGASSLSRLYKNGVLVSTIVNGTLTSTLRPYFFGNGANGSLRRQSLILWGSTQLTEPEISNLYTYVLQYQTLLGRQ